MKDRIMSTTIIKHGGLFTEKYMENMQFDCPECKTPLSAADVSTVEPAARHSHNVAHRSKVVTAYCGACGCVFKMMTVKGEAG